MTGSKEEKKSRKDAEKFKISYFQNVHTEIPRENASLCKRFYKADCGLLDPGIL